MTNRTLAPRRRRGIAAVEMALVLTLLLPLLLGLWEVGRLIEIHQLLSNAAREGSRQASTGQASNQRVQQVVVQYLRRAGLPTQNVVVTVANVSSPDDDVADADQLDRLSVTVSVPFKDVRWLALDWFVAGDQTLSSAAEWLSMRDLPLTVSTKIPIE